MRHSPPDFHIIFIIEPVFKHVELQDAYHAYNNLFHTGIVFLKNLDGAFLGRSG